MSKEKTTIWQNQLAQQLVEAMLAIDSKDEMQNFLRDVMTEKEIAEVSARLEAARMLQTGSKYTEVTAATKLSSRTVARISDWMQNGCGGYATVLDQISKHHSHIPPASAV
jgi:TrpR-related protein YerC/YecD